jgi:hypothetical protein
MVHQLLTLESSGVAQPRAHATLSITFSYVYVFVVAHRPLRKVSLSLLSAIFLCTLGALHLISGCGREKRNGLPSGFEEQPLETAAVFPEAESIQRNNTRKSLALRF